MGALCIALSVGEAFPAWKYIGILLALGFVAYGLSVFFYTYAQRSIGAARTSTYYAFAPFIGAFLSFVFLKEPLTGLYLAALSLMIAGAVFAMADTIVRSHIHKHHHFFTHTHDGSTHTHEIFHAHGHNHYVTDRRHGHQHSGEELEKEIDQQ